MAIESISAASPHALLEKANLGPDDFSLLSHIYDAGYATFLHGSITRSKITDRSDVDFTLVGELSDLPADVRRKLLPGAAAVRSLIGIDYISTGLIGQYGRKMSIHLSQPEFRSHAPGEHGPFAQEYRPGTHAKKGRRHYFLAGADTRGGTYLIDFHCDGRVADDEGGTITATPQTGIVTLEDKVVTHEGVPLPGISAQRVIYVASNGRVEDGIKPHEEVAILGLEFDKMREEIPLSGNPKHFAMYVEGPRERSKQLLAEYTGVSPDSITQRLMGHLAEHWHKVKDGKPR